MKRYQKHKRSLLERHRRIQNKQLLQELQELMQDRETPNKITRNFQSGFLKAVNEVSRLLAITPNVDVELGKAIMTHLGLAYNRLMTQSQNVEMPRQHLQEQQQIIVDMPPVSPASSGYYSDCEITTTNVWRPW